MVVLFIRSVTLPGALDGIKFLFIPTDIFNPQVCGLTSTFYERFCAQKCFLSSGMVFSCYASIFLTSHLPGNYSHVFVVQQIFA